MSRIHDWAENLRRMVQPRPTWRAEAEYDYYQVDPSQLAAQWDRQTLWQRQGQLGGLLLCDALGLCDRERLTGLRVLEIGAGECMASQALHQLGAEVWAVDAVPKQIWAAAAQKRQAPLHCLIGDALDLPFAPGSFDLVVANLVIHHVRPLSRLFGELLRVLAPGGQLVALEPSPLVGLLVHDRTSDNEAPLWPQTVVQALTQAGFADAESSYQWVRLRTARLGPLSPSYRVSARKPGPVVKAQLGIQRPLVQSELEGLLVDEGCSFGKLATAQIATLAELTAQQRLR
jgi:SAM-dependent methyltransferase